MNRKSDANDRFNSRYHFAFADGYLNLYHLLLFGKERHMQLQLSNLPMNMGIFLLFRFRLVNQSVKVSSIHQSPILVPILVPSLLF